MSPTVLFSAIYLVLVSTVIIVAGGEKLFMLAYVLLSVITYAVYAIDKKAAQQGQRRTPENTLHLLALLGGWPGALFAQSQLRHKSKKQPFKAILWLTIVANIGAFVWLFTRLLA